MELIIISTDKYFGWHMAMNSSSWEQIC